MRMLQVFFFGLFVMNLNIVLGQEVVSCVKLVTKSCNDAHGAWPGTPTGIDCAFLECATETSCTTGEPATHFWNTDLLSWHWPFDFHVDVTPGEEATGRSMRNPEQIFVCKYIEVCDYDCEVDPMTLVRRCKRMYRDETSFYLYEDDLGPCFGPGGPR